MTRSASAECFAVLKPLYSQVRDMLAMRISGGEWGPGAMLPNETNLAATFGVSIGTIRRAVEGLEEMGLVVRKQGRGTYVGGLGSAAASSRLSRLRTTAGAVLKVSYQIEGHLRRAATTTEIAWLHLPGPAEVLEIRILVTGRNARIGMETSILPAAIAAGVDLKDDGVANLYAHLGSSGVLVTTAEDCVSSAVADATTAQLLRVAPGAPVLCVRRIALGIDQRPVELRHGIYLSNLVTYANRIV